MTDPSDNKIERLFYVMDERKHPSDYELQADIDEERKAKLRISERFQNFMEGRKSVMNPKFWAEWQEGARS
jgi:hypothetical protein